MIIIPFISLIAAILMAMWAHHEKSKPMYGMALCLLITAIASVMILGIVSSAVGAN